MKLQHFILILIFSLAAATCKKLPEADLEGRDVMAAYVDGKKWVVRDENLFHLFTGKEPGVRAYYQYQEDTFLFKGVHKNKSNIRLIIDNVNGPGAYIISPSSNSGGEYRDKEGHLYQTSSTHTGTVNITYLERDSTSSPGGGRVMGTFSMEVERDGEVVEITDGRFSIYDSGMF